MLSKIIRYYKENKKKKIQIELDCLLKQLKLLENPAKDNSYYFDKYLQTSIEIIKLQSKL